MYTPIGGGPYGCRQEGEVEESLVRDVSAADTTEFSAARTLALALAKPIRPTVRGDVHKIVCTDLALQRVVV